MSSLYEVGPEYVVRVRDTALGLTGFLVIDNTALGPGKGGIRMTSNITEEEVFRLARTMTWKNALSGIPFGGAKAGIVWPGGSLALKKKFIQSFARAIKVFTPAKYIAGPDVNTGEKEMQWFVEATGNWRSATGKPATFCMRHFGHRGEKCGIPHEFGSTGFGVAQAAAVAAEIRGINIKGAIVAIHGFGNVGTFAYKFLTAMGATVVALADKDGAVVSPRGFEAKRLHAAIAAKTHLSKIFPKLTVSADKFWRTPTDILIPASVTDVIHAGNKNKLKTRIIVEAGNIPMQESIETELFRRGVVIVPDFVANAGGVISSYAEYRGYNPSRMFALVKKKITSTTRTVLEESRRTRANPRTVAMRLALSRVIQKNSRRNTTF